MYGLALKGPIIKTLTAPSHKMKSVIKVVADSARREDFWLSSVYHPAPLFKCPIMEDGAPFMSEQLAFEDIWFSGQHANEVLRYYSGILQHDVIVFTLAASRGWGVCVCFQHCLLKMTFNLYCEIHLERNVKPPGSRSKLNNEVYIRQWNQEKAW